MIGSPANSVAFSLMAMLASSWAVGNALRGVPNEDGTPRRAFPTGTTSHPSPRPRPRPPAPPSLARKPLRQPRLLAQGTQQVGEALLRLLAAGHPARAALQRQHVRRQLVLAVHRQHQ